MGTSQPTERALYRRCLLSLVFSLVVIITGIAWTWQVGRESNKIAHRLAHLTEGLEDLQRVVGDREVRAQ